jgi:bifunctional non-homologous end joining protein LigD
LLRSFANLRTESTQLAMPQCRQAYDRSAAPRPYDLRVRYRRNDDDVFLYAFDLIELSGDDLRREPLEVRKATLRSVLIKRGPGIRLNEHIEGDGESIFRHACKLGFEGIVSKRKDSPYRSGRSPDWLKKKNPGAPAVKREAEEDWGEERWR